MSTGDARPAPAPAPGVPPPELELTLPLGLLDSGTTRTRLRLWDGPRQVVWQGERRVGARDVARAGHPGPLLGALSELLAELPTEARPRHLVCSGMITSRAGLREVAHVRAPAGAAEVAGGLEHLTLPGLPPLVLIPGILTPQGAGADGWHAADVLRGEEVEVFGLREVLGLPGQAEFLHLGSHHKLVQVDAEGRVTRTVTSLAGEALLALSQHTILASSVPPLGENARLEPQAWADGLQAARTYGVGRALFLVRVGQQFGPLSRAEAGSFLHGVLAHLTLDVLRESDPAVPLVVYGYEAQARCLTEHLRAAGRRSAQHCDAACLDEATVRGTLRVLRAAGATDV